MNPAGRSILALALIAGAHAQKPAAAQHNPSRVALLSAATARGDSGPQLLGILIAPQTGWKTYWRSPGESGLPPVFAFKAHDNTVLPQILWPAPSRLALQGQESYGYDTPVIFPFHIQPQDIAKPVRLEIHVDYAVCKDICVPEKSVVKMTIPPGVANATADLAALEASLALVPQPQASNTPMRVTSARFVPDARGGVLSVTAQADTPFDAPDIFADGPSDLLFAAPVIGYAKDRRTATFDLSVTRLAPGRPIPGQSVTLTLVDGERAVERQVTVAQEAGTK